MRLKAFALLLVIFPFSTLAKDEPKTVAEALARAAKLSQITLPGSAPFHVKARVAEIDSPDSDYKAEIEEYWAAPDKWQRTVKAPDFSQTMIVNGSQVLEQNTGNYYPVWLGDLVTAIFDLAPKQLAGLDTPYQGGGGQLMQQIGKKDPRFAGILLSPNSTYCSGSKERVGIAPVQNSIFTSICFLGDPPLLKSVVSPYYHAEFEDYRKFKDKQVARRIKVQLEPGTELEARIGTLEEFSKPEGSLFVIQPADTARIQKVRISEEAARAALLNSAEIAWAPVRDGKTTGSLSIFVSVDKEGKVRETWPLNSDNPFPQDQVRKEVMQWRFKPFEVDGVPAQMETILTFGFNTTIGDAIPVLTDAEARKLATSTAEPEFLTNKPPAGTTFTVRAAVDEKGEVIGLKNPNHLDAWLVGAANVALHRWHFRPYMHNGKPDRFDADITFHVK